MEIQEPMIELVSMIEIVITDLVPDSLYEFKVTTNGPSGVYRQSTPVCIAHAGNNVVKYLMCNPGKS